MCGSKNTWTEEINETVSEQDLQAMLTLFQVYDDNDDYSEDNDRDDDVGVRPKFGIDIFSVFVPVSNFFSVIWKLFCTFVLKLEKTVRFEPVTFVWKISAWP